MNDQFKKERSEALHVALEPFAEEMAKRAVEELEVKGSLLQPKATYREQKKEEIIQVIDQELAKIESNLYEASSLLKENLIHLPEVEKKRIEKEMGEGASLAHKILQTFKEKNIEGFKEDDTFQSLLHLSDETILWMYQVGYNYFETLAFDKALMIFQFLNVLNPLISDYWLATGLTQRRLQQDPAAVYSFSMASLMNPDNPYPHYHSAEIHLNLKHTQEAASEISLLENIIEAQKLADLKPSLEALKQALKKG
jgi:hypothetical protein